MRPLRVGDKVPEACEKCGAKAVYVTVTGTSCDHCGNRKSTIHKWWWFR